MGLRLKNFDIMGVHWKIWFLGEALHENQYTGGGCFKRGLGLFADLRKGLEKKRGMVFLRGGGGGGWYSNAHYGYGIIELLCYFDMVEKVMPHFLRLPQKRLPNHSLIQDQ